MFSSYTKFGHRWLELKCGAILACRGDQTEWKVWEDDAHFAAAVQLRADLAAAQADNAALRALLEAHQVSNRRHVDEWRQRAKALSGHRDAESVTERATLLDCASELDSPLPAALAPRPDAGKETER
jgi:hypothetical protein